MLYDEKKEEEIKARLATQATLVAAAHLVRTRGLAKMEQEDSRGRVCLHGAISIAVTGSPEGNGPAICRAERAVCLLLKSRGVKNIVEEIHDCARWNNEGRRTAEEVAEALESAVAFA